MQHEQLRWIIGGCLSLFGLGICYRSLTQQQKIYRNKLQEFEDVYKQSKLEKQKPYKEIVKQVNMNSSKIVCLENLKSEYQNDTFKLYQREISVFSTGSMYKQQAILEHQMGNEFYAVRQGKEKLLCKLNDFHLAANLLKQQRKDVNLFKEVNKLEAIVQTVALTLFAPNVAIYGKLYYDSNRLSWAIEPFFLTRAFQMATVVERFYQQKIASNDLAKFAIFVGGIILSYFTIVSPLKSWFRKKQRQEKQQQGGSRDDMGYFKNKSHIIVKGESLLNCEKCRRKNVEMVYECGHLAICLECHNKNATKECPLCGKVSTKFMKIYMA